MPDIDSIVADLRRQAGAVGKSLDSDQKLAALRLAEINLHSATDSAARGMLEDAARYRDLAIALIQLVDESGGLP